MRTTLTTMNQKMLTNLNKLLFDMTRLNESISSQRQMSTISDNPSNLVSALGWRTSLAEIKQYSSNLEYGTSFITASETSMQSMKEGLMRARVLAISAINGATNTENKIIMATEVANIFEQSVTLANTQINGKYIFAGYRTVGYDELEPEPFMVDQVNGFGITGQSPTPLDALAAMPDGYAIAAGDLEINGVPIEATVDDGFSSMFADASAEAKAAAINATSDQTGVTAVIIPVNRTASGIVQGGTMDSGDLIINGIDIFDAPTDIVLGDTDDALLTAINAKSAQTGIAAGRDSDGKIILTTLATPTADSGGIGRNLHIQTSANGESISHLNGSVPPGPQDTVYFGGIQLRSDRRFMVETELTASGFERGLAALGLDGGTLVTGLSEDAAGDGSITVNSILTQEGNVRYAGDRENDIAVKIGKQNTLDISKNGQDGIMDTGVFSALKDLENYLRGTHYTAFHSEEQASDTSVTLDSGNTGLARADELIAGNFEVTVTDYAVYPPTEFTTSIAVDPAVDTLQDIATKINGVPGVSATWDSDGYLQVEVADADRYSIVMDNGNTNFLDVVGLRREDMQTQALASSLIAIDDAIEELNNQIADFGARANRITVQNQIYDNLELASSESLSEVQDTDILEALMQFTSKETAYQAALTAASRTMQLSLVNFL